SLLNSLADPYGHIIGCALSSGRCGWWGSRAGHIGIDQNVLVRRSAVALPWPETVRSGVHAGRFDRVARIVAVRQTVRTLPGGDTGCRSDVSTLPAAVDRTARRARHIGMISGDRGQRRGIGSGLGRLLYE